MIYRAALTTGFETLRMNPFIGVAKPMLLPDLRAYRVERHLIYYRVTTNSIEVVRILDERADAARHLR